jgi:hypothetical protein
VPVGAAASWGGAIHKKTKEAIADFEQKQRMPVNGRASQKVLEALRR